ncbi:ABC transporter permease [Terriglobus sp. ADX1]|uniref:ABC transporter permease n=1 Tax=Terriglobus sp. ADX1 TaxID=2794063 RepID=UPI002FE5BFFF
MLRLSVSVRCNDDDSMNGTLRLAYKLLVNDRAKFITLLVGIGFSVFLMVMMLSMFAGVLNRASATVINIGAKLWVMDPAVNTVANTIGLPDYTLDAVRSMKGVKYAVPLFSGGALVKLDNGTYQPVSVLGLDDSSLFGRPEMEAGHIEDIYAESSFIVVHDSEYSKLGSPKAGTTFELNDHRGVVVGTAAVSTNSLFGVPTLYTTYYRAIQYIPNPRFTISYVLVEPKTTADIPAIQKQVSTLGYLALTREGFEQRISRFYMFQTGLGMNLLMMTAISFIVGLSISGQTFYTFILENIDKFGALKAIGTTSKVLVSMILFQASFTALTGYGLGIGFCALAITLAKMRLPDYAALVTYQNLLLALVMVIIIAAVSGYVGVRKVLRIEPFDIFRG